MGIGGVFFPAGLARLAALLHHYRTALSQHALPAHGILGRRLVTEAIDSTGLDWKKSYRTCTCGLHCGLRQGIGFSFLCIAILFVFGSGNTALDGLHGDLHGGLEVDQTACMRRERGRSGPAWRSVAWALCSREDFLRSGRASGGSAFWLCFLRMGFCCARSLLFFCGFWFFLLICALICWRSWRYMRGISSAVWDVWDLTRWDG